MIAKMTKEGVLQVYAETEAEIYMLKCWEKNYKDAKGAAFETFAEYEPKTVLIPQFSIAEAAKSANEYNMQVSRALDAMKPSV